MRAVIILPTLLLLATLSGGVSALAQESINVRIHPDPNSTLIGKLSSLSLAVTADWPKNTKPVSGWRPIHYRGDFLVYLDSQDIGKNFLPIPGSRYLISPRSDADILAIATDLDKAEIISIDPRFFHINLETIVLGYIRDYSAPPTPKTKPNAVRTEVPKQPKSVIDSGQSFEGILVSASYLESTRSGYKFKLINSDNETIAYVDHSKLSDTEPLTNFVNTRLTAWGTIDDNTIENSIVLRIKMLRKKN
ncbi:MAG TPA: hypothetical protein DCS60_07075 [Opitutae bacterium]|nr:hypothetical protein [Opitutae bacterium]|tara:strand:+ start:1191 stop:1937 length:747 start_codon:yes stop_codon:yes gene_type:complete